MRRSVLKFPLGGLSLFATAAIFLATFLAADDADAGAPITGVFEVQFVCHDGGNRGESTQIYLTKYAGDPRTYSPPDVRWTAKPKAYYDATECFDLSTKFNRGDIVYAWYRQSDRKFQCPNFRLKYVPNRTDIWIQTGGATSTNVTCVAKWSLKGHINSPVVRPPATVYEASEVCHDGANRGAEARILVSDGINRWLPQGMTFKGYYTKTQCFKLPNLKNGTMLTVYHQQKGDDYHSGKSRGMPCGATISR